MDNSLQQAFGLGIKHSIFNNEIRKRRLELGLSQKQLAVACGFHKLKISFFETFKTYPTEAEGLKLAEVLNSKPEILFPQWLKLFKPERTSIITEHIITEPLLANTLNPFLLTDGKDVEDNIDKDLLKEAMFKQLDTLSDRERRVLEEKFGLLDGKPKNNVEIGKLFGVTNNRIMQIEHKALRKLRHPSRAEHLKSFVGIVKTITLKGDRCGHIITKEIFEPIARNYKLEDEFCSKCYQHTTFRRI